MHAEYTHASMHIRTEASLINTNTSIVNIITVKKPQSHCQCRASDFPFQKKQFSVSKKVKFRFDSVSLLATLNSMKSQYIERKCGERPGPSKWHGRKRSLLTREWTIKEAQHNQRCVWTTKRTKQS